MYNRQDTSLSFQREVCDSCEQGLSKPEETDLELEKNEYPKIKSSLSFGLKREIEGSTL